MSDGGVDEFKVAPLAPQRVLVETGIPVSHFLSSDSPPRFDSRGQRKTRKLANEVRIHSPLFSQRDNGKSKTVQPPSSPLSANLELKRKYNSCRALLFNITLRQPLEGRSLPQQE